MASAMMLPMVSSLLAEMVPTWAISRWSFVLPEPAKQGRGRSWV